MSTKIVVFFKKSLVEIPEHITVHCWEGNLYNMHLQCSMNHGSLLTGVFVSIFVFLCLYGHTALGVIKKVTLGTLSPLLMASDACP